MSDLSETVLVTHANCLDGLGCAACFIAAGGNENNIIFCGPHRVDSLIKNDEVFRGNKKIIFADIAPHDAEAVDILSKRGSVTVIDHHRTSAHLVDMQWCVIDESACGCSLLYDYLSTSHDITNYYSMTDVIDTHDRWQFGMPFMYERDKRADSLALFNRFYGAKRTLDLLLIDPSLSFIDDYPTELECLREQRARHVKSVLRNAKEFDIDGIKLKAVFLNEHVSFVLHELLSGDTSYMAAAIDTATGYVSLRSAIDDVDCEAFAKRRGGGGHVRAAGFSIKEYKREEFFNETLHGVLC